MKRLFVIAAILTLVALPIAAADDAAALFTAKCGMCHGAKATGMKDLTGNAQKLTDEQLTDFIANGGPDKKKSHDFKAKGLTDDQIKGLVAYIRTLKK